MKKILLYSVMHTGTWFLMRLLRTAEGTSREFGDAHICRHGRPKELAETLPIKQIDEEWYLKNFEPFMFTAEEQEAEVPAQIDFSILHFHHLHFGTSMMRYLQAGGHPAFPLITPIRDPLLAVNTLIWREYKDFQVFLREETFSYRVERMRDHANKIKDLLTLPSDRIFVFPIDRNDSEEEKKTLVSNIFQYCDLKFGKGTAAYITGWQPQNRTQEAPKITNFEHDNSCFEAIKSYHASGDKTGVRKMLYPEFNYLQSRDDLKTLFQKQGYKSMLWW